MDKMSVIERAGNWKHRSLHLVLISLVLISIVISGNPARAESPDLTNMGRVLKYNKEAIEFIDICISNLDRPKDPEAAKFADVFNKNIEDDYNRAIQRDFQAQVWYLQRNYSRTYKDAKKSQNILQDIYRRILENYIDGTWAMLEEAAPLIVKTRDRDARHLLKLGYRDLESSRLFYRRGHNINPYLHTNQMLQYREGIKRIRRARRYALLALIEAKLPRSEKPQFQVVTLDDVRSKKKGEYFTQSSYTRVLNYLINLMGRKLLQREITREVPQEKSLINKAQVFQFQILEIHQDNYGRLQADRKSVWQKLITELDPQVVTRKESLPNRNSENRNEVNRNNSDPKTKPRTNDNNKKDDGN